MNNQAQYLSGENKQKPAALPFAFAVPGLSWTTGLLCYSKSQPGLKTLDKWSRQLAEHLEPMACPGNIAQAFWNGPVPASEQQNLFNAPNLATVNSDWEESGESSRWMV